MPEIKLSDLTAITPPLAAGDLVGVVDVSDTTQAVSGSTRKVTMAQMLQAFAAIGTAMSDPVDTDVLQYYDGAAPTTPKNITPAELRHLLGLAADMAAANTDRLRLGARLVGGRAMLSARGQSGRQYALQPALFSSYFAGIFPGSAAALSTLGCGVTSVGTISHPAATQITGYMANQVTGGAAGNTAGTGHLNAPFFRGDGSGLAAGFHFTGRLYLPDASYDETGAATTGSRIFAGLYSGAMSASVASDNPAGDMAGFARNSVNAGLIHANWQIVTKDGTTVTFTDTGVPFAPQNVFDLFLYQPIAGGTLYWRIDNLTAPSSTAGSVTANLPTGTVAMRHGAQVQSVNAVARNIRHQHLCCEADL